MNHLPGEGCAASRREEGRSSLASPELGVGGPSSQAHAIKEHARALGFDACGITDAAPPPHHRAYTRWLAEGRAGEMLYLHRQEPKRGDLTQVLPGAQSVVCVALNYSPDDGHGNASLPPRSGTRPPAKGAGQVARYARFPDYHEAMWAKLNALLHFIQELEPGANGKVYCDTGPVTERDLAMRAGLGWIGKHTSLLSQTLGNWFFLGEILLDVALPPDTPTSTHCGTCTRCISSCPTGAIVAPYQLDARRCISYLTIELKGAIPVDLRPLIGTRIYGCDDCLAACPWNKFAKKACDPAVQTDGTLDAPALLPLLELTEEQFQARFRTSPIRRTKRQGLLRNVCVALGNAGDVRVVPALARAAAHDPSELVREHAQWALSQLQPPAG